MSNDEDDYLSDKLLAQMEAASKPQQPRSYAERRKHASKQSQLLNEQNRKKSRKQLELEAREEGLQTSLIQKAQEEAKETGKQNKALAIMMKMGFKPGQSLGGNQEESSPRTSIGGNTGNAQTIEPSGVPGGRGAGAEISVVSSESRTPVFSLHKHRAEPLPIKEWSGEPHRFWRGVRQISNFSCSGSFAGKTGIGGVKRPPSPTTLERAAKVAKQSESLTADEFRNRARKEYEDRRAEGKLRHARATCVSLDTDAKIKVCVERPVDTCFVSKMPFPPLLRSSIDSGLTRRIRNRSPQGYWRHWRSFGLLHPQVI